jgi:rSAM-associated Gly-rich repeat protein
LKTTNVTWLGFIATLTALSLPTKTLAYEQNLSSENKSINLETRLDKIADSLHSRAKELKEDLSEITNYQDGGKLVAGWLNGGGRGGFLNNSGGGGFLNNRRWPDGGGFLNRRY